VRDEPETEGFDAGVVFRMETTAYRVFLVAAINWFGKVAEAGDEEMARKAAETLKRIN
jgi:hypothetical protein